MSDEPGDRASLERLASYLRTHGPQRTPPRPDFLLVDAEGMAWLVRWPNGSMKWESTMKLATRGYRPESPIISEGVFTDPEVADAVAARLQALRVAQGRG